MLATAAVPPPASAACRQDGEVTIARNAQAHVVGKRNGAVFNEVHACLRPSSERIEVEAYPDIDVEALKLRGVFVAYDASEAIGEEYSRQLTVRDLRERTSPEPGTDPGWHVDEQDPDPDYPQSPEWPFLGRFALRPNGSIAFTAWHDGRWRVSRWRIGAKRPVTLDSRPGIDPSWLKVGGDRVRWRRRGVVRSARLP